MKPVNEMSLEELREEVLQRRREAGLEKDHTNDHVENAEASNSTRGVSLTQAILQRKSLLHLNRKTFW
jgi:hypothetical protein